MLQRRGIEVIFLRHPRVGHGVQEKISAIRYAMAWRRMATASTSSFRRGRIESQFLQLCSGSQCYGKAKRISFDNVSKGNFPPPKVEPRYLVARFLLWWLGLLAFAGCTSVTNSKLAPTPEPALAENVNVFDRYLKAEFAPADGFDLPFGDAYGKGAYIDQATGKRHTGWYLASHFAEEYDLGIQPGEDWNGVDEDNTELGQEVYAVANGRVVVAENFGRPWGNVLIIEHIFFENHEQRKVRSVYAHLVAIKVKTGESVDRQQRVATVGQDPDNRDPAPLHIEMRWDQTLAPTYWPSAEGKDQNWVRQHYAAPSEFINTHRKLFVPTREATLLLIDPTSYKMRLYQQGKMQGEYDVSFGQSKGQKRLQGDNKTPRGMYFIIYKHRGKFAGDYGRYYGGHWIKINYPNRYDASWGVANGVITPAQQQQISARWQQRAPTLETTGLGGGIGFHGWIREWDNSGPRHLSWGCVVLHIYDISRLYDQLPEGAMVVIL
ncbi:MAG: peptidoglycan DD-metalloendopeptidase family protein [Acidobacteria bacterium]|nr:peptidoglycan DD-metalloendopeptidase family protein [Acidobacteriota bacterium]